MNNIYRMKFIIPILSLLILSIGCQNSHDESAQGGQHYKWVKLSNDLDKELRKSDSITEMLPDAPPPPEYEMVIPPPPIEEEVVEEEIIEFINYDAQFPGGVESLSKFIQKNMKYPEIAREMEIQGKVFVQFNIERDGSIAGVKVVKGVHPTIDKEAVRVVKKMPKWDPAETRGKRTKSTYTLPLNFKLQ